MGLAKETGEPKSTIIAVPCNTSRKLLMRFCMDTSRVSIEMQVKEAWKIQYPADEAAAASRADSLTEPTPVYSMPNGRLRRFPQVCNFFHSEIFFQ